MIPVSGDQKPHQGTFPLNGSAQHVNKESPEENPRMVWSTASDGENADCQAKPADKPQNDKANIHANHDIQPVKK